MKIGSSSLLKFCKPSRCCGAHNHQMRIADALMDSDDDFSGDSSIIIDTAQVRRRRRRENTQSFVCLSPRSLLFRWWSSSKKSKGKKILEVKSKKVEREPWREGLDGEVGGGREEEEEVGCSMIGLNGESSSCVSELKAECEIAEVSGQYRKEDCFNLAVGFGVFYLITASKNELNKMMELRTEMEMLLQNLREEFHNQSREILSKPSESNEIPACSTIDTQEILCSNGRVSLQNLLLLKNPADSETTELCNESLTCKATGQEKSKEGIDQLEAELEAELERLQLRLDTEDIIEYPRQQRVEDTAPEGSLNASFGEVVDPPEAGTREQFGIPPNELERRLHELLESRQLERIKELEAALECANQKLFEKEREVCWWKDTARLISHHVPKTSR